MQIFIQQAFLVYKSHTMETLLASPILLMLTKFIAHAIIVMQLIAHLIK